MTATRTRRVTVTKAGGLRQRAWWYIRKHGEFTLRDLLSTVATGKEADAEGNIRRWLRALALVGILSIASERAPGAALTSNGHYRYRLVRDLGRLCPVWRTKAGTVYDPNSRVLYPVREGEVSHA